MTWAPFARESPTDDIQRAGLLRDLMLPLGSAIPGYYAEQRSSQQVFCAVQYDTQKSQNPLCTYTVFVIYIPQTVTCLCKQDPARRCYF